MNYIFCAYIFIILIIYILFIIGFTFHFYQITKLHDQNKILNNIINYKDNINDKYKKKLIKNINNLSKIKESATQPSRSNNYFLEKLIRKSLKYKNLILLNNYLELDKLFTEDPRYDGARNCLVESEFNSTCIYNYLYPKKVYGKTRILVGGRKSTGYVMLDELDDIKIAYSFGIGDQAWHLSFDKELADKKIDVYMYDHTIKNLPYSNPKFHYNKVGLSGKNKKSSMFKSFEEILNENGHLNEKNMILKMDIEYGEWESLLDFPENLLKNFKFMLFELHFINGYFGLYSKVLAKLSKYHQIFYVHCVNCGNVLQIGDMRICSALEVSYVIKEGHKFEKDDSIYPIPELETICKFISIVNNFYILIVIFSIFQIILLIN